APAHPSTLSLHDALPILSLPSPALLLLKTKREPWSSVMIVALTPVLLPASLMASRIPSSVLLVESMVISANAELPTLMLRVPVRSEEHTSELQSRENLVG